MKAATRRARIAQTVNDVDPETLAVVAMLANTNPLYLSDQLLKLMKTMNLDFTREFLDRRNQITKEQRAPPVTTPQPLPKQYSSGARQANTVSTAVGLTSIHEEPPSEQAEDISAEITSADANDTLDKFAALVRLYHASRITSDTHDANSSDEENDYNDHTSRANPTFTIRGDYERAVTVALASQENGTFQTISDGGADTWILGKGWRVLASTNRHANVIGFDSNYAKKKHLPIVVGAAVVIDDQGHDILLVVFEGVSNADSPVSLLGEYQTREAGNMVDSVSKHHKHIDGTPGRQSMRLVRPMEDCTMTETVIPFTVNQALMTFGHRPPTDDELKTLPRFLMTPQAPWIPPDQVSDHNFIRPANDAIHAACLVPSDGTASSVPPAVAAMGNTERGVQHDPQNDGIQAQDKILPVHVCLATGEHHTGGICRDVCPATGEITTGWNHVCDSTDILSLASSISAHPANTPAPVSVIRITPDDPIIADAPYFYDPSDVNPTDVNMKAFHLSLDHEFVRSHEVDTLLN
jgi:hypothetical protein